MYYGTLVLLVQQLHIKHRSLSSTTSYVIHKYFLELLAILANDCTNKNTDYVSMQAEEFNAGNCFCRYATLAWT